MDRSYLRFLSFRTMERLDELLFHKILIANRGEIAVRIIRACKEMGIATVAVYSEADREALHVTLADEAVCIGPAKAIDSYLHMNNILNAAILSGVTAIHPGVGFLSENAVFARKCEACNITFIGPSADIIEQMGNKVAARKTVAAVGVPTIPGTNDIIINVQQGLEQAKLLGFPIMIKASAGGGGKGMRVVQDEESFESQYRSAKQEALAAFGEDEVYLEKYIEYPRHIEIQLVADCYGNMVYLGERDCSLQRMNQKMIEEAPSPIMTDELRRRMGEAALKVAKAVGYVSLGTIEFLLDQKGEFYFMEMNTRIQVEHPVTEMVTGIDLVKEQIRIAAGERLSRSQEEIHINGHSIECRINAEDPMKNFRPCPGTIHQVGFPSDCGVRVDTFIYPGYKMPSSYDSLIAKVITHGRNREEAITKMRQALTEFVIDGIETNLEFHIEILNQPEYMEGRFDTGFLKRMMTDGMMEQCPACQQMLYKKSLEKALKVCKYCGEYLSLSARERLAMLLDEDEFEEYDAVLSGKDPLEFPGYPKKLQDMRRKTGLREALITGKGRILGEPVLIGAMDTRFFMGSMGSAEGERLTSLLEEATKLKLPVIVVCASGGARMQEGIFSLMQMAKVSAAVQRHHEQGLLYIPVLTNPTTGGVTASFAMQGDIILAEPNAMIGFAGPRVIQQTIGEKLPEGFQRAEFLLEHGFIDRIVERKDLRKELGTLLRLHRHKERQEGRT